MATKIECSKEEESELLDLFSLIKKYGQQKNWGVSDLTSRLLFFSVAMVVNSSTDEDVIRNIEEFKTSTNDIIDHYIDDQRQRLFKDNPNIN